MKVEHVTFAKVLTPRNEQTAVDPTSSYPIAGVYGFGRGLLLRNAIAGTETNYKALTRLHLDNLVYSKVKAFEGAFAVVGEDGEGRYVSPEFPVFRMNGKLHPAYVRHYVASEPFMHQITAMSSGIGARRERVSPAKFLTATIPLPSLPDQRRIAAHLDSVAATARRDQKGLNSATQLERAWLGHVFAADRPHNALAEMATVRRGSTPRLAADGESFIGQAAVRWGSVDPTRMKLADPIWIARVAPEKRTQVNDVLVNSTGEGTIGRAALVDATVADMVTDSKVLTVRTDEELDPRFLTLYLRSPLGQIQIEACKGANTTKQTELGVERAKRLGVPIYTLPEQQQICAEWKRFSRETTRTGELAIRREALLGALLPAARNEVFSTLR